MKKPPIPDFETELAYEIETFEDNADRKPTEEELKVIRSEVQEKVDSAKEAYDEYVASGAFECAVCGNTHFHHAPKPCRDAYNSDRF